MSTFHYTQCDVCGEKIDAGKASYLRLSLASNQTDNRAFVHLDSKTFKTTAASTNGRFDWDVCQTCAPRFGVDRVRGNPEFAAEAREERKAVVDACEHSLVEAKRNYESFFECEKCFASEDEIKELSK